MEVVLQLGRVQKLKSKLSRMFWGRRQDKRVSLSAALYRIWGKVNPHNVMGDAFEGEAKT